MTDLHPRLARRTVEDLVAQLDQADLAKWLHHGDFLRTKGSYSTAAADQHWLDLGDAGRVYFFLLAEDAARYFSALRPGTFGDESQTCQSCGAEHG